MTPKLLLPIGIANVMLVVGFSDSIALLAVGFIVGQGLTLFFLSWWMRAERAERKAWTDALLESHESATALIRAADLRGLIEIKPSTKEIA
jgi:poly(3-hydroxyalkanoate) synthetase